MATYIPKIIAIYNKHKATQVTHEARKACPHQAFRASFTLAELDRPSGGTRCTRSPGAVLAGMPFMATVETINHHCEIIIENLLRSGDNRHTEHNSAKFPKIILYGRKKAPI